MEKIKLNNRDEFELIPMGIDTNDYEKKRIFSFISELGYNDIETDFASNENIGKIEYYSASDELLKTYDDCITLKSIRKEFNRQVEDDIIADVYSVELEII